MCLDIDISPFLFWDSSLQELYDLIASYNRRMKLESEKELINIKKDISLNAVLARQIGEYVASMFSSDVKITPVKEFFSELFAEEKVKKEKLDIALYKAKMEEFAFRHNEELKRKGGSK